MAVRRLLPPRVAKVQPDVSLAIVNIVLLLIFFFLASGSLTSAPTNTVEVSETFDLPIEQLPQPILIVEDETVLSLNGDPIMIGEVPGMLGAGSVLHVLIARDAPAHRLLDLLDDPALDPFEIRLVTIHRRSAP
jgi:biopolymer transport protein ExbD